MSVVAAYVVILFVLLLVVAPDLTALDVIADATVAAAGLCVVVNWEEKGYE